MIILVTADSHRYTHRGIARAMPGFRVMGVTRFLTGLALPFATYILTDFDRLSTTQLEVAAKIAKGLRDRGLRVLNDPARARQRLGLLTTLYRQGINSFRAWPAEAASEVDRFPVFLRTAASHRGNLTDLLADRAALEEALEAQLSKGVPLTDLMIIEYRSAEVKAGVFRKYGAYRLGDRIVGAPSIHEVHWNAKYGRPGLIDEDDYLADLARVRDFPFVEPLMAAFRAAEIDYGRADFNIVDGRVEVYEINTNPAVGTRAAPGTASPSRVEAINLSADLWREGLMALDDGRTGPRITITHAEVKLKRRLLPHYFIL